MNKLIISVRNLQKIFATIALFAMVFSPFANVQLAKAAPQGGGASADLDQAENGGVGNTPINPVDWVNGNVNQSKGHYSEGESIPYRMLLEGLTVGVPATLIIGFDVKKSNKFAIDYITSNNRIAETVDPCDDIPAVCSGAPSHTLAIPAPAYSGNINGFGAADVLSSFNDLVTDEGSQVMKIWNGTLNTITYSKQANLSGDEDAQVTVVFTPSDTEAVISWGGHISSSLDYPGESAINIPGSPYHTRLVSINGAGGNQDRSLSASAVEYPGNLIVIKEVIGGTKTANQFTINVSASTTATPNSFSGDTEGTGVTITVPNNGSSNYSVVEVVDPDYQVSYSADCVGTIVALQQKVCTITNTYVEPIANLTLVKNVVNTGGGTAAASAWTLTADSSTTDLSGAGGTSGEVTPGTYTLTESTGPDRYSPSDWSCVVNNQAPVLGNQIILENGDSATCTITNTYVPPAKASITVVKTVTNDNGGTATENTFDYFVNGVTEIFHNVAAMFDAVPPTPFTLTETNTTGYTASDWGGDCATDGTVTLGEGESATCTITNDDIAPKLTVTKVVTNNSGTGNKVVADFPLFVGTTSVASGAQNTFNAGSYVVSETNSSGYSATFSGDCDANGNVTLAVGDVKSCTITNDDNDPTEATITINKSVVKDFGGNAVAQDFSFLINGTSSTQFESDGSNQIVVTQAGAYTITEPNRVDYTEDYSQCSFNVVLGQSYSCTVVNTQLPACSDGLNNDGREDQLIDYPADPGCDDGDDNSEGDPETSITIDKVVVGEGANADQSFGFNFSWTQTTLDLALSANATPTKTVIQPGQGLVITEDLTGLSRWNVQSISCGPDADLDENPNSVTLNFDVGEQITCVFTNNHTPRDSGGNDENIIIKKEVTEGSDVEQFFNFNASWLPNENDSNVDFMLKDNGLFDSGDLQAGEWYSISEVNLPSSWTLENVACTSSNELQDVVINASEFLLNDNETITCTFTNDEDYSLLTGYKFNDENTNGIWDEGENGLEGWTIEASLFDESEDVYSDVTDENGFYTIKVPAGSYGQLTEVQQNGWTQTAPFGEDLCYFEVGENSESSDCNFGNHRENTRGGGGGGGRRDRNPSSSSVDEPIPQVLGEATSVMPVGAPNTGAGGTSPVQITLPTLLAILSAGNTRRSK